MGLGPHHSSLLQRTGQMQPGAVWTNSFAMQMEAQARGEARRERAIWMSQKNRTPRKLEAPAEAMPKEKGHPRAWRWIGEAIPSKGLHPGIVYQAKTLRKAGFKLPKIGGKK